MHGRSIFFLSRGVTTCNEKALNALSLSIHSKKLSISSGVRALWRKLVCFNRRRISLLAKLPYSLDFSRSSESSSTRSYSASRFIAPRTKGLICFHPVEPSAEFYGNISFSVSNKYFRNFCCSAEKFSISSIRYTIIEFFRQEIYFSAICGIPKTNLPGLNFMVRPSIFLVNALLLTEKSMVFCSFLRKFMSVSKESTY